MPADGNRAHVGRNLSAVPPYRLLAAGLPAARKNSRFMISQDFSIKVPICPLCGENLTQPDGPGLYVCASCGWEFPSNDFESEGVRKPPSPADEGFVGTELNSELRRWIGLGERNEAGLPEIVRDFQGKPITTANSMLPPDRKHVLRRIYDKKEQKTWEERQLEAFWLENCEKIDRESLKRAMKLLQEKIAQEKRAYRDSVKGFMRRLSS